MSYLIASDYHARIKPELFAQLIANAPTAQQDSEDAAQDEMISYLSSRFDTDLIFLSYPGFNASAAYAKGSRMVYNNSVYEANQDLSPAAFDAANWTLKFQKNGLITRYYVAIALNDLYSRLQMNQIPDHIIKRRDDAIQWLSRVAKGDLDPKLPFIPSLDGEITVESVVKFGSKPKFSTQNGSYF